MFGRKKGYDVPASAFDYYKPAAPAALPALRDGKDVNFWYDYSQEMKRGYKELVEYNDNVVKIAIERKSNDAGLRAVIRSLLAELRKTQPDHPLLDKDKRDRIFHEFANVERAKVLKRNELEQWETLKRPDENQSE